MRLPTCGLALLIACSSAPPPSAERPTLAATPADAAPHDDATDVTLAARWTYAAYFNHMKKAVYQVWDPVSVFKQLPASRTRDLPPTVTIVLHLQLSPTGAVDAITVKTSSTIPELDAEGARAFRAAGPFSPVPDPPPKLEFDFALYFELGPFDRSGAKSSGHVPD